ncbi:MAG: hypothetical protein NVSMB9_11650 [Isosphaeraceae bacterium]
MIFCNKRVTDEDRAAIDPVRRALHAKVFMSLVSDRSQKEDPTDGCEGKLRRLIPLPRPAPSS